MHRFCDVVNRMVTQNIPFFLYRLPSDNTIRCGIQRNISINRASIYQILDKEGFVFAPFENKEPFFIIPDYLFELPSALDELEKFVMQTHYSIEEQESVAPSVEISQDIYLNQCNKYIEYIQKGTLEKAILSRCVKTPQLSLENAGLHFVRLEKYYPDAYVFLVHLPGITTWIGATPETLLKVHDKHFVTMSLAGTQKWEEGKTSYLNNWSDKDKKEQAIVTEYICNQLESLEIPSFTCTSLGVKKAGGVGHLQTVIQGEIPFEKISVLIKALHPTPAVCGSPKEEALKLIHELEPHSREFYAGYLGYNDGKGNIDLYVNLRSARLLKDYGFLYVGGGITADSDPLQEWEETCLKSKTILNALNDVNG